MSVRPSPRYRVKSGRLNQKIPDDLRLPYTVSVSHRSVAAAIVAGVAIASVASPVGAQRVRVSPHEAHAFTLDGSKITFEYGRPSKRGREIWGGLVPWGKWWMPGADEATIVTTDAPLVLGETLTVPAGQHTIYMLPDPDGSKLIINKQVGQFHTYYNARMDLGRVDLTLRKLADPVEQLTFAVEDGRLKLIWDDREYSVGVVVRRAD